MYKPKARTQERNLQANFNFCIDEENPDAAEPGTFRPRLGWVSLAMDLAVFGESRWSGGKGKRKSELAPSFKAQGLSRAKNLGPWLLGEKPS